MKDIEIKNAKTIMIAGIAVVIVGTTILIVKNKDQIKLLREERKARKIDRQIAKLEALGYQIFKRYPEDREVEVD